MASGWAPDGAVQDQIDDSIADALTAVRLRLPSGDGREDCELCGDTIPEKRRLALPRARTCVACQSQRDRGYVMSSAINRRGSKDSQLR